MLALDPPQEDLTVTLGQPASKRKGPPLPLSRPHPHAQGSGRTELCPILPGPAMAKVLPSPCLFGFQL